LESYEKAIAIRPNKNEAWYNLGRLYSREGDNEKSSKAYSKIVSDFTNSIYFDLVKEKLAYL